MCYTLLVGSLNRRSSTRLCLFNVMPVVLSCHLIEVQGSLPRVEFLTFRGYIFRTCDIPLARAVVVSPWLCGSGCALPCFGFVGFRCCFVQGRLSDCRLSDYRMSDCRIVGLSDVGLPVVGLLWKWVSAALGEVLDQAGHKSPP